MQHQILISPSRLAVQQKTQISKNTLISPQRFPNRKISQGVIEDFVVRSNYITKTNNGSLTERVNSLQKSQKSVSKDKVRPISKQLRIPTENFFHITKGVNLLLTQKNSNPQQQNSQQLKPIQGSMTRRNSMEELIGSAMYTGIGKSQSQDKIQKQEISIYVHYSQEDVQNYRFTPQITTDKITNLLKQKQQNNNIQIIGFSTLDENYAIDYYLQQPNLPMDSFINKTIRLKPIYNQNIKRINLSSFQFISIIGKGGFSTVILARSLIDGKFIALKLINKQFILQHQKQDLILNERDILIQSTYSGSIFTNQIECAFETKNWIVFGIEYCPGGEMFNFIKRLQRLSEQQAKFYIIEVILAIGFLHNEQIIYRDIKPENILIDSSGHIQLADFGLARPNMTKDTCAYSFCGSPEYMAPEMFQTAGHTQLVDYYCLGCLLYEFVTGLPPFYAEDKNIIYARLLKEQVEFPDYLSTDIKDLIRQLMVKDPHKRLGSRFGIDEIFSHKWFKDVDLASFINKQVKPPYIPDLQKLNIKQLSQNDKYFFEQLQREQKQNIAFQPMFSSQFYFTKDQDKNNNNVILNKATLDKLIKKTLKKNPKQGLTNLQLQTNFENLLKQTFTNVKSKPDSRNKQQLQF
ncbi:unnamed protein product (macronuclear) [Paramecium tetraurelia]|uniref:Protein kinase domain-containing protein n=1 Tax=Paramecium tetraurelia TaxID=5888 RepID=A0BPA4_PARTE|nr:uncharacterized protein GSPATT00005120001 [Paramecium tetraurelia]CAK60371.1 unnamed protein product [Paramecium tetraurelia]|eukprot:XP_001427769.1 hypothetical protein (macronuclear) [Paramecium tetraurelia strain d4-2]